jgi:hypothetical protein
VSRSGLLCDHCGLVLDCSGLLWLVVGLLWLVVTDCGLLWLVPCFSKYAIESCLQKNLGTQVQTYFRIYIFAEIVVSTVT